MRLTTPWDRRNPRRGPGRQEEEPSRLGALDVLGWSVWLGLSAGLLEVGTRVLCRAIDPTNRLYLMSRHFVWLVPLANMLLFFGLGVVLGGYHKALAPVRRTAEPPAAVRLGHAAHVDAGCAGDLPRGLVRAGPGDFVTIGSLARIATGQTATVAPGPDFSHSFGICPVAGGFGIW